MIQAEFNDVRVDFKYNESTGEYEQVGSNTDIIPISTRTAINQGVEMMEKIIEAHRQRMESEEKRPGSSHD